MKTLLNPLAYLIISFSIIYTTTSCEGEDGIDGINGEMGQDGNANVIASDWFTPNPYTLSPGSGDVSFLEHNTAVPEITQEILDTGVVLVYGRLNSYDDSIWPTNQIGQLPITVIYEVNQTIHTDTWSTITSPGNLKIKVINSNNFYSFLSMDPKYSFRYIIIPSSKMIGKSLIDYSDYQTIISLYDIPN